MQVHNIQDTEFLLPLRYVDVSFIGGGTFGRVLGATDSVTGRGALTGIEKSAKFWIHAGIFIIFFLFFFFNDRESEALWIMSLTCLSSCEVLLEQIHVIHKRAHILAIVR